MLMCEYCQQELQSRGEKLFIGYRAYDFEESETENIPCGWCDEYADLWEVKFINKGEN